MADAGTLYSIGIALILLGMIIAVLAFILAFFRGRNESRIRGGGAVIIGPVPIVFGTDKKALKTVLILSIVLTLLLLTVTIISYILS